MRTTLAAFIGMAGGEFQNVAQMEPARFPQPAVFDEFDVADVVGEPDALAGNFPARIGGDKTIRRAAGGDDDRQAAGHCLQHRHSETFAAIGQHQTVARRVKRRHLLG